MLEDRVTRLEIELEKIKQDLSNQHGFNEGVMKTIYAVTRIVVTMTAFISAVGAAAWAIATEVLNMVNNK